MATNRTAQSSNNASAGCGCIAFYGVPALLALCMMSETGRTILGWLFRLVAGR